MRHKTIALVWIGGLLLTAALYVVGPDRFLDGFFWSAWGLLDSAEAALRDAIYALSTGAFELVHALAIGLYVVFVVLAVMAAQRGIRARGTLLGLSVLFFFLIGAAPAAPGARWVAALAVAGAGAVGMTRRLLFPPRPPLWWRPRAEAESPR